MPNARISRPFESWSIVDAVLASQNGSRIGWTASAVPTSSVVVAAAQNDSTVSSS